MSGNLYMPIVCMNVYQVLQRKLRKLESAERLKQSWTSTALTSTQSSTDLSVIPDSTVDFIYVTDHSEPISSTPEVNRVIESWLRVHTNPEPEAVIDVTRKRKLDEYSELMTACSGPPVSLSRTSDDLNPRYPS